MTSNASDADREPVSADDPHDADDSRMEAIEDEMLAFVEANAAALSVERLIAGISDFADRIIDAPLTVDDEEDIKDMRHYRAFTIVNMTMKALARWARKNNEDGKPDDIYTMANNLFEYLTAWDDYPLYVRLLERDDPDYKREKEEEYANAISLAQTGQLPLEANGMFKILDLADVADSFELINGEARITFDTISEISAFLKFRYDLRESFLISGIANKLFAVRSCEWEDGRIAFEIGVSDEVSLGDRASAICAGG